MKNDLRQRRRRARSASTRKGSILVLGAALLVVILAFVAFTVDLGYVALTKTQLQNAADAAALAAALELNPIADQDDVDAAARQAAVEVAALHRAGNEESVVVNPQADVLLGRRVWYPGTQSYEYQFGPTATPFNIVRVDARRIQIETSGPGGTTIVEDRRLPLFFAPVVGHSRTDLQVSAMATFQPRDMVLVLDYSASMNDDSEFGAISSLGQAAVEAMIQQMWQDLDSPTYGSLPFYPQYATLSGQAASGCVPHIDVTWKGKEIFVQSTKDLSNVVLKTSNGATQKFDGLSGKTGTFKGTSSSTKNREIVTAWVKSGCNSSGDGPGYGERFNFDNNAIIAAFGLNGVSYPGQSGSWSDFINYVKTSSSVNAAGFRYKFGIMCLINYWNEQKPLFSQTNFLWQISQQPITALKDATDLLLDYLTDAEAEDRVGLSVYTYPPGDGALLESSLTTDFNLIKTISRQRQAGHYDHYTNIGAGMRAAREELEANARPRAFRMMVLMTDGIANRSSTSASPTNFALDEAELAAAARIKIMTISLGVEADTELMQEIADRTGGIHFNVPGGASVADYEQQLQNVFAEIAADRPLQLIPVVDP